MDNNIWNIRLSSFYKTLNQKEEALYENLNHELRAWVAAKCWWSAIVAAHQSGRGYKAISKLWVHHSTERKIIHKWKRLKPAVNLPRSGSHRTWAPCSHWVHHELLWIPKYSRVKYEAICPTAKAWLKLAHQQDNDPKHSSRSTTECLKKKRIKVLQWSSQSPDLSLTEMLWLDLQRAVHKPMLQTSMSWSNIGKKSGPRFLHNHVRDW